MLTKETPVLPTDPSEEEEMIAEALGANNRSSELRGMRQTLEHRKSLLERELQETTEAKVRKVMERKIQNLDAQIEVIHEEERISEFVEGSVRLTIRRTDHTLPPKLDDED